MKILFFLIVACAVAGFRPPASAGVTAGVDQTFGTGHYLGTKVNASLDLTDAVTVSPSFSMYRSDFSTSTRRTIGARIDYERGLLNWGLQGDFQPKVDGYRRSSVGGDVAYSLLPGEETFGWGLAGVELGGALTRVMHTDDLPAAGPRVGGRRPSGPPRTRSFSIGQTDLAAFGSARFPVAALSAGVTKSLYDKTLDLGDARVVQALELSGFDAVVQGFPDLGFYLKLQWKTIPFVRPHVSWVRTSFKLGDPPSNGVELGGVAELGMFKARASWERYTQSGSSNLDYFTLGSSVEF